jgi:hypothetical protein
MNLEKKQPMTRLSNFINSVYLSSGTDTNMQAYQNTKIVAGLNLSDWTKKFWEWLFQLRDEANPVTVVGPARPWRYAGRQPTQFQKECMKKYGESVWFIATAPYSEPNSIIQLYIPVGNWWILVAPAVASSSQQFYPSLNSIDKVRKNLMDDINKTIELWTILDGFSIPWYYIDNSDTFIEIKDVPANESKNMMHRDLAADSKMQTLQCGYWNFIEPVTPGDHLLTIHSRSPIYRVDITYQLSVTGPADSPLT